MTKLLTIVLISLLMFSCGENLIVEVVERYDKGNLKVVNYNKKIGNNQELVKKREYYEEGTLKVKVKYSNDIKNGEEVFFDKEGNVKNITSWRMGRVKPTN